MPVQPRSPIVFFTEKTATVKKSYATCVKLFIFPSNLVSLRPTKFYLSNQNKSGW
jgi:hypothetical protein